MNLIEEYPEVWGPHYWFFLHTIIFLYPDNPNDIIKKKYFEFIQNIPVFIPGKYSKTFIQLLDEYPVQPYLTSKSSLIKWSHFIHNKMNEKVGNPIIDRETFLKKYWGNYKPKDQKEKINKRWMSVVYISILVVILVIIGYLVK